MKTILIFHEKHSNRVFDASTTELTNRAFHKILKERQTEGYLIFPEEPTSSEKALITDEALDSLPEEVANTLRKEREEVLKIDSRNKEAFEAEWGFYSKARDFMAKTPEEIEGLLMRRMTLGEGIYHQLLSGAEYCGYSFEEVEGVNSET